MNDIEKDRKLIESIRCMASVSDKKITCESRFTYRLTEADKGTTAKQILKNKLGFSSRLVSDIKKNGTVYRNGTEVRLFSDVIPGDLVEVILPEERSYFLPQNIPLDVVYEDADMLIINKPPFLVVHPTKGHPMGTVANALVKRMEDTGNFYKIRFVNRLDRDTSGLLIVAKNSHCQDILSQQMKNNQVEKKYWAVVHGHFDNNSGTVDLPIGRKSPDDIARAVIEDGYPSITHYKVLESFSSRDEDFSLLELQLETGRTHQIRVHMSYIGHPLVGDPLYGKLEPELLKRQALHAIGLKLYLPISKKILEVVAPLPDDIRKLINGLEKIIDL